jgi:DNA topoisomerase-1
VRRHGRYGAYVACSNYPACRYKPPKPVLDTGVKCPKDGGVIAERRGRFRPFYGCVNYPDCDFTLSVRPIPEACPQCGNPYLLLRERKGGRVLACDRGGCGFEKPAGEIPPLKEVFLPPRAAQTKPPAAGTAKPRPRPARNRRAAAPAAASPTRSRTRRRAG